MIAAHAFSLGARVKWTILGRRFAGPLPARFTLTAFVPVRLLFQGPRPHAGQWLRSRRTRRSSLRTSA